MILNTRLCKFGPTAGYKGVERRFYIVWRGSLTIQKPAPEEKHTNFLEQPLEVAGYYKPGIAQPTDIDCLKPKIDIRLSEA
jgi:hypothetical protein